MKAGSFSELGVIMRPGMSIRKRKSDQSIADESGQKNAGLENGQINIRISIRRLEISASVGVYEHEINRPRPLILDIEVSLFKDYLVKDDKLHNTIDYDFLANSAIELGKNCHYNLVETYAQNLAERLISNEKIASLALKIEKPDAVSGALSSCVELNWVRN